MEALLRRLLRCFGRRHRKAKPQHRRHDSPRGGTDGAKRSLFRPTRPSGAARSSRRSASVERHEHETPTPRRRRWLRRLRGMNRVAARSPPPPCGTTTARAVEPRPPATTTTDAAAIHEFSGERAAAAATIQAHFRGHLARQAFRALRSLVKLQAFARGAYVRKQAGIAIRCMKVLVRLQVRVRSRHRQQLLLRTRTRPRERRNNDT